MLRGIGQFFSSLSIMTKLVSTIAFVIAAALVTVVSAQWGLGKQSDVIFTMYGSNSVFEDLGEIKAHITELQFSQWNALALYKQNDPSSVSQAMKDLEGSVKGLEMHLDKLESQLNSIKATTEAERKLMEKLRTEWQATKPDLEKITSGFSSSTQQREELVKQVTAFGDKLLTLTDIQSEFFGIITTNAGKMNETATILKSRLGVVFLGLMIIAIFALVIGIQVAKSTLNLLGHEPFVIAEIVRKVSLGDLKINFDPSHNRGVYADVQQMVRSLQQKVQVARQVSDGDLSKDVVVASDSDELGQALQKMTQNLRELTGRMTDVSITLSAGASEIDHASQSLSSGASEQAASLEEIAATVNEIGSQMKVGSEQAVSASKEAIDSRTCADQGLKQIDITVNSMKVIADSSTQISKIIKVIDDIAFQTNLLALNAAVEAARAGSHGKGFAVVADEVRSLASRSAKAAQETSTLIESSGHKVDDGLVQAEHTAATFKEIATRVNKVAESLGGISQIINQQASRVAQVALAVDQISRVTQQNTASAEETAASAVVLSESVSKIKQMVEYFRR